MAGIPDDKLQELRNRIDIVDLISRYVGLSRAGKNFKACCPFHSEKTPSFFVNPQRKSYKCFGCGVGGDGLQFVMETEGLGFLEAAYKLAELYGVLLPRSRTPDASKQAERDAAHAIIRAAVELYRELLVRAPEGAGARAYQEKRRISDEIADTFRLGYAPAPSEAGWDRLARELAQRRLPLELAERLGLIARSERTGAHYDKFRGRLMFPVIQAGGTIVGFSGRILPEHEEESDGRAVPKYMNSPESMLYKKSKTLFGLHAAAQPMRRRGRAILVEGNVDVVAMHQLGYHETCAPLGTALTGAQVETLSRFTDTVVLCFDGDKAGRKAARAAIPLLLDHGLDARIVHLGDGEDPDSTDPERLATLLEAPGSALEWLLERMVEDGATQSFDAQARALGAILPLLRKIKREAARDLYIDRAANLLNLSPGRISALLHRGGTSRGRGGPPDPRMPPPGRFDVHEPTTHAHQHQLPELPREQARLATLLIDNPHIAGAAERAGVLEHVTDRRLEPIVKAVLEHAATDGELPGVADLLSLIDERAQRQVHDIIFAGTYRDETDPQQALDAFITDCRRKKLKRKRHAYDIAFREAQKQGDRERMVALSRERIELNRELGELDRNASSVRRGQA